jgi:uncharacterized RDD family membrane protein YckC
MEKEIVIASRKSRIFAYIIDYAILNFIIVAPLIMILMKIGEQENIELTFIAFFVSLFLFLGLYSFKDAFRGQSIGKWFLGIGVRDEANLSEIPSVSKLFLRNLTHVLGFIEFLVLAVNKNKQRLGDKLAKTVVVKTKEMSVWKKIVVILSAIILSVAIMFVSIVVMFKSSEAYKVSEDYLLQDEVINRKAGGIEGFGLFPSGSIQTSNGYGEALLTIKVKGKEKDLYVDVYLTKEPRDEWYVQEAEYYE